MNIVIVGHVDHGKSTIIGRLLADTGSLPDGKLEAVKETCRRNSRPFEYAFLLDALREEQAQGITIDVARCFFKTDLRDYMIIDAPGHIEFLKNMITGASSAEAALLVIDADEGVQENSRRHGYMLSLLGIRQIAVLVNKMDLAEYSEERFNQIKSEYNDFLEKTGVKALDYIPVSGMEGDNIASLSSKMPWYEGNTVLQTLDSFKEEPPVSNKPFRMPVQGVYKFTRDGDNRRIVAGTVESGTLKTGSRVIFYPSGKKSTVKTIESFNTDPLSSISAGDAAGFTLTDQIYISRGHVAAVLDEPAPLISSKIRVFLFWLGVNPMIEGKEYLLKTGTAKVPAKLEKIINVTDASTLDNSSKSSVEKHDVAECVLSLDSAIAFDLPENNVKTSRFVIVDDYEISGGGLIREALSDKVQSIRQKVITRNRKWVKSQINEITRAERYTQKPTLIVVTGKKDLNRKRMAKHLEKRLFNDGRFVYFMSMGNLLYGIDADIKNNSAKSSDSNLQSEHFRRLAEVSNLMLDAGMILIVSIAEMTNDDMNVLQTAIAPEKIITVWLGEDINTDLEPDLHIDPELSREGVLASIKGLLRNKGIVFSI